MKDCPIYARCSLGPNRWFWVVWADWDQYHASWEPNPPAPVGSGCEPTADLAVAAALACAPTACAYPAHDAAYYYRVQLCRQRMEKRSAATSGMAVEFLYRSWWSEMDDAPSWLKHRIIKRTKSRVYVDKQFEFTDPIVSPRRRGNRAEGEERWYDYDCPTFVLDRIVLERDGSAWSNSARDRFHLKPENRSSSSNVPTCLVALGLTSNATEDEIRSAYRRLAQSAHPDRGGEHESFLALNADYEAALVWSVGARR